MANATPPGAGGISLGTATGQIIIINNFAQATQQLNNFASQSSNAFGRVNQASNQANSGLNSLANSIKGVGAAFGIAFGVQTIGQIGQYAIASAEMATAFERQEVAARNLAGSQAELNSLLDAYGAATGHALSQATEMQNVTKLMAVGFADSTSELTQFATAIRGISIAMGQSQDYITQNLILESFSQRGARLDQLGLQYDKVRQRAEQLQAADASLTAQQAYQNAVLDQAIQRYGALANSAAGAATGIEQAKTAWDDLSLALGKVFGPAIQLNAQQLADDLNEIAAALLWIRDAGEQAARAISGVFGQTRLTNAQLEASQRRTDIAEGRMNRNVEGNATVIDVELSKKAQEDLSRGMDDLLQRTGQQILEETSNYERQRARTIANYEEQVARSAADFAKQQVRAQEDYERQVLDVMRQAQRRQVELVKQREDAIADARANYAKRVADFEEQRNESIDNAQERYRKRVADAQDDYNKSVADAQEKSAKKLLDLEEDYQRQRRQKAEQDSLALENAAGRLDANAAYEIMRRRQLEERQAAENQGVKVSDEQDRLVEQLDDLAKRYKERLDDEQTALDEAITNANKSYAKQVEDEKTALQERIDAANKAYEEQLQAGKDADALRLQDMEAAYKLQRERAQQDQIDRLGQMKIDFQEELTQMESDHQLRLTQISTHATQERTRLETEFNTTMYDAGVRYGQYEKAHNDFLDRQRLAFNIFWAETGKAQAQAMIDMYKARLPGANPDEVDYLNSEIKRYGGIIGILESQRKQAQADYDALIPQALIPPAAEPQGQASAASVTMGDITVVVGDIGNRTNADVEQMIANALLKVLKNAAGTYQPGY